MNKNRSFREKFLSLVICVAIISGIFNVIPVFAAQVTMRTNVGDWTNWGGPRNITEASVFISDQTGYFFYCPNLSELMYTKTTDGGANWSVPSQIGADNICNDVTIWYDQWTPGDTAGTKIHIMVTESVADDMSYIRFDTSDDSASTIVNASDAAGKGVGAYGGYETLVITKGTDGDLYMARNDATASKAYVLKCPNGSDCTQAASSWVEAGTSPMTAGDGTYISLLPLAGGNMLYIEHTFGGVVQSKVYTDGTDAWDAGFTNIQSSVASFGATASLQSNPFHAVVDKATNDIYLAYVDWDAGSSPGSNNDDDIRTAVYSGGSWTLKTDVLTDAGGGENLDAIRGGPKLFYDQTNNTVYAFYQRDATTTDTNFYYKTSADGMTTWSAQSAGIADSNFNQKANVWYGFPGHTSDERVFFVWGFYSATYDLFGETITDMTTNTAPTVSFNSAAQKTDGTGVVDISIEVDDADDDDTVTAKLEYKAGADCSSGTSDPTLDETDGNTTADFGDPKVENDNAYQVGNASGYITTSSGSNTVLFDWLSATDVAAANGTYCIKVTANDATADSASATTTLTLDNLAPSGLTGLSASAHTTANVTLAWTAATETNFNHYEIWYGTTQADVQNRNGTAVEWDNDDDANLTTRTTATTTITGLGANTGNYYKIWAVDNYGNEGTVADVLVYNTANTPGAPTVVANATTGLNAIIDQNSNPSTTEYAIKVGTQYVQADGTLGAGEIWQTYTNWGGASGQNVTGLSANTQYAVSVKARNGDNDETELSASTSKYTYASAVADVSLANATTKDSVGMSLSWTDAGQSGVKIDLSSVSGGACDATYDIGDYDNVSVNPGSPRAISGSANTCYKARIGSYNGDGVLNTAGYVYSGDLTTPSAQPTSLAKSAAAVNSISWNWDDVTAATTYKIYRSSDDALIGQTADSTSAYTQTTVTDGGAAVSANTQYTVYVRAVNANGEGIASSTASAYTAANTPTTPGHEVATQTIGVLKWTWASGGAQKDYYAWMDSPATNSGWIADLFWTVSAGLSTNTQYTFNVKARNGDDVETTSVAVSAYTSQGTPSGMTFSDVGTDTITITATGTFANLASGSSGIRFQNTTTSADNTFQAASWVNSSLSPNVEYSYTISGINGDGDETSTASSSKYTLANVPGVPTVNNAASTTLDVAINVNSNPATTTFAIYETVTTQYVQTDGTLGASAVWQTVGTTAGKWGNSTGVSGKVQVNGLSSNTSYNFQVKARNGENVETALGTAASLYTTSAALSAATVNGAAATSLAVTIDQGGNNSSVTYKIQETGSGNYVQADGTLGVVAVWQTADVWGTVSGVDGKIVVTGLSVNTQYTFAVTPRNSDLEEGSASATASLYTLANVPGVPIVNNAALTTLDVAINVNSNPAATTFAIYETGTTQYVQVDGTLGASAVWQTVGTTAGKWGNSTGVSGKVQISGLSSNISYNFQVKARNNENVETAFGTEASLSTTEMEGGILLPNIRKIQSSVFDDKKEDVIDEKETGGDVSVGKDASTTTEYEFAPQLPKTAADFSDVAVLDKTDRRYLVVDKVAKTGLFVGQIDSSTGKRVFGMEDEMNRAMAAVVIARYIGCDMESQSVEDSFVDVSEDAWYADSVACLKKHKIVEGRLYLSVLRFEPASHVTMAEFFKMVIEAYLLMTPEFEQPWRSVINATSDSSGFATIQADDWYRGYFALGVISGNWMEEQALVNPDQSLKRIEVAAIMDKILGTD